MGTSMKRRDIGLLSRFKSTGTMGGVICVLAVVALISVFACQQKVAVRPPAQETASAAQASGEGTPSGPPPLLDSQCVNCHPEQPKIIAAHGGKHKTEVGCQDCHVEHPPQGTEAIPECSMCHSGEPHFDLKNCGSCHADAHAPLDLKLEGEITDACLTCHKKEGEQLKAHPSAHTDVACNECHEVHGQIPDCTKCHEKHTEDMDFKACVSCHPVHMPLVVTYGQDTPNHYCGACHEEAQDLLAKNKTKHHDLTCVFCHKNKHKTVPPCYACHPNIHPKDILDKFPECGQCHGIAHDVKG